MSEKRENNLQNQDRLFDPEILNPEESEKVNNLIKAFNNPRELANILPLNELSIIEYESLVNFKKSYAEVIAERNAALEALEAVKQELAIILSGTANIINLVKPMTESMLDKKEVKWSDLNAFGMSILAVLKVAPGIGKMPKKEKVRMAHTISRTVAYGMKNQELFLKNYEKLDLKPLLNILISRGAIPETFFENKELLSLPSGDNNKIN